MDVASQLRSSSCKSIYIYIYEFLVCSIHPEGPKRFGDVRGGPQAAVGLRGGSPPGKAHMYIAFHIIKCSPHKRLQRLFIRLYIGAIWVCIWIDIDLILEILLGGPIGI